jgi:hypothetical protein
MQFVNKIVDSNLKFQCDNTIFSQVLGNIDYFILMKHTKIYITLGYYYTFNISCLILLATTRAKLQHAFTNRFKIQLVSRVCFVIMHAVAKIKSEENKSSVILTRCM